MATNFEGSVARPLHGNIFLLAPSSVGCKKSPSKPDDTAPLPTDGLILHYPFNGNANDESGNGNHGEVFGASLAADRFGRSNSAYSFIDINDYINIGTKVKPYFPITVSCWVKIDNFQKWGCLFRNDYVNHRNWYHGIMVRYVSEGKLEGFCGGGFAAPWSRRNKITTTPVITSGNWHHVLIVFNALNDIQIFADGVESDGIFEGTGTGMTYSANETGVIGKQVDGDDPINGIVDDIRVYKRSLSQAEIQALYHEGGWKEK